MKVDDQILDLLEKWEETVAKGTPVDPTSLAGNDPKLAAKLRGYVGSLQRFDSLKRANQVECELHLPTPQELGSSLLLPEGLELATLQAHLTKADVIDAEELKQTLSAQPTKNVYQFCNLLLTSKLLTRFQLRAIARGQTRGLKLGRYIVQDRIGAGGMGQVFKAWHSKMGREVALKVIHGQVKNKSKALARFYQEVQASAQLRHVNIVTAFDADEAEGVHFLVMEYVPGSDLHKIVRKTGPLSVTQAVDYFIQAARGLEYAHRVGLLHRDIKPANLLIDEEGVLKILDMGIARLTSEDDPAGLTQEGSVMGTVDFMSPEQAVSSKTVKPQADLYSLGCSFYYFLTGRPPFEGEELMVKLLAHREQTPPSLSQFRSDVPLELDAIYQKCLEKLPADRYQSATELIAELERIRPRLHDKGKVAIRQIVPEAEAEADTSPTSFLETQQHVGGAPLVAPQLQVSPAPPGRRKRTVQAGGGSPGFYGGAVAVALLLTIIGYFGFGALFKVSTPHGNLIVSIKGDAFVAHLRDQEIHVVNTKTNETVDIKLDRTELTAPLPAGPYKFAIETSSGLKTDVSQFTITSGENSQVEISWEKPAAASLPAAASSNVPPTTDVAQDWVSVFNGRDMRGWSIQGPTLWRVASGSLIGVGTSPQEAGWIMLEKKYDAYELEFEYKLEEGGNSGVFLNSRPGEPLVGSKFLEIQIIDDAAPKFRNIPDIQRTGSLHNLAAAKQRVETRMPGWHKMRIRYQPPMVQVAIDNNDVLSHSLNLPHQTGSLAFQRLANLVEFRNIRVRDLTVPPTNPSGGQLAP
ncbi:protein kinase domain-containing protein [Blastopirellula marina]|uniref:non-specific serine/threonine protein kinase n=1 Tax=Blastopirellula marina DSM 3645 TaxID=314230 RepID=A3ZWI0_9BACT|nr:protein kinase [Blastopirellula marina]EAQ79208.1 serine/threonine protein kinase [Blastopirellula marina DSM 3645]